MKVFSSVAAAAVLVAAFSAAPASAAEVHGKIMKINPAAKKLMISHHVYRFGPKFNAASLAKGQTVRVSYRWNRGHREALQVLPGRAKPRTHSASSAPKKAPKASHQPS